MLFVSILEISLICLTPFLANLADAEFKLTVLHVNDIHARFAEVNKWAGKCKEKHAGIASRPYRFQEFIISNNMSL